MIRIHEVFQPEEQISNSGFCQFVIEFLTGTLHVSQALLVVNYTSSNKVQYISSCAAYVRVFDKFEITGLI